MKKRINEVVSSHEHEAQKSVEIIVVSGSNRISSIEMKMTENGTISERKDGVSCVDREERTLADPRWYFTGINISKQIISKNNINIKMSKS